MKAREKTIQDLTLMLMYLTSWEERDTPGLRAVKKVAREMYPLVRRCWKGYDHRLLDKLSEAGLIRSDGRTSPAYITPEGETEARSLLAQYGLDLVEQSDGGGETTRLTDRRIELEEDDRAELDRRLSILVEHIQEQPEVTVVWFLPDEKKAGGQYVTTAGQLKKIDDITRILHLADGTAVPLDDVLELRSDCFRGIFPHNFL